jgi:hypothetical protein
MVQQPQQLLKEKLDKKRKPRTTSEASSSSYASTNSGKPAIKPLKLQFNKGANPVIQQEKVLSSSSSSSGSSSDSSDEETPAPSVQQYTPYQVPVPPKTLTFPPQAPKAPTLSDTSSSEDEEESKLARPSFLASSKFSIQPLSTNTKPQVALKPMKSPEKKKIVVEVPAKPVNGMKAPAVKEAQAVKEKEVQARKEAQLVKEAQPPKETQEVKKPSSVETVKEVQPVVKEVLKVNSVASKLNKVPAKPVNGMRKSHQKKVAQVDGNEAKKKNFTIPKLIPAQRVCLKFEIEVKTLILLSFPDEPKDDENNQARSKAKATRKSYSKAWWNLCHRQWLGQTSAT